MWTQGLYRSGFKLMANIFQNKGVSAPGGPASGCQCFQQLWEQTICSIKAPYPFKQFIQLEYRSSISSWNAALYELRNDAIYPATACCTELWYPSPEALIFDYFCSHNQLPFELVTTTWIQDKGYWKWLSRYKTSVEPDKWHKIAKFGWQIEINLD